MAVTSGTDSRTLLAASRDVSERLYYFVNDDGLGSRHPDITVPRKMCDSVGIAFHVHDVPNEVDEEFRRVYLGNTFLASERLLPAVYNVFFKHHQNRVLILGVGEIGRTFYGREPENLSGYRMAYKLGYAGCRYVTKQCEQMRPELQRVAGMFNLNSLALLYWEQRLGNWGGVRNSESALAIEKVDPYDSHLFYDMLQGVDEKYRSYKENPCAIYAEMIRRMWPELLDFPTNPPLTMRDRAVAVLDRFGLFESIKELKYQLKRLSRRRGVGER
jgi:hypothetical protein